MKNDVSSQLIQTKTTPADCLNAFKKSMKRATRDFAIAMILAFCEPTLIGEAAAVTLYYCWIDDAQEDYNDCMAGC